MKNILFSLGFFTCYAFAQNTITDVPAPIGSLNQAFCDTATVVDLSASGENIQWYDASIGGNVLNASEVIADGQVVYASQTIGGFESIERLEVIVGIQNIQIAASSTEVCEGEIVDLTSFVNGTIFQNNFCSLDDVPNTLHETLLGAWPFCGNANDISGNNFNGTLNGGVTPGINRFGEDNNSYIFDGQPLTYISMGSHELLDITEGSISISAWVDTNNVGGTKTIVSKANTDTSNVFGSYTLHLNGPANFIVTNSTSADGYYSILSAQGLAAEQWKHLTAVADIEDLKLRLYFDGLMVSEIDWEGTYKGGVQEFLIGSHYKSNFALNYMYNFNGSIDDVAIWNRVLNQYEIDYLSMSNSTTYLWSTGDTSENIAVTPTETTEYWIDVTTNGITCREYITINVTAPASPTGNIEQTFCESSTISDLSADGNNIQWYDAPTVGNLLASSIALIDNQTVYASQTINGCESNQRLAVTISILDIQITATATEVCAGESIDLTSQVLGFSGITACNSSELPSNLQNGLVGYWPFCGDATDTSGNGNNGIVSSSTLTDDRFNNIDNAFLFSDASQSKITINPSSSLNIINDITFSAWFYPTDTTVGYIVDRDVCGTSDDWGLQWMNGQVKMRTQNNENEIVSGILELNNWYNVIVTRDAGTFTMYINSEITSQGSGFNYNFTNSSSSIIIGDQSCTDTQPNFDGKIDDVAIWNRALSQEEVLSIYQTSVYTWSTGDITENISVTPTETTEYWVDVTTNGVTCREYITINVTAPPAPTGNAVGEACSDLTVGTNNNSFNGENILWYDSIESQTPLSDDTLLVDGTTYYISQTVDGCESIDRFEILILAPLPTITIDNPIICEGESTTVSVSTNPFLGTVTYLWNSDENETSDFIITAPTESSGGWVDVSLIYEYEGGIVQNLCRYFYSITVQEAPEPPVSGGDITECETIVAQNLEATASVSTGQTIVWYDAASGGNVVTDSSLSAAGTATYYAETINDDSGCSSLSRTSVTLTIISIAAPTGDSVQSFCDVSTIADLMVTGDNIQWYDSSTGDTLLDQTTVLTDGQLVYASQTENECESIDRLGVSVETDIITDPILITTELDFCLAREATLADLEIDAQGFELEWYDSFSGGTMLAMDTLLEDNASYYATLYDATSGCESLMRLEVVPTVIPCEVIIFNAISLNDNGLNDYMVIENAEYFPFNTLEIFNRDGHLIYSQKKYGVGDNLFRGIANVDGIYSKGSNLPTGSYLYVFTYYNPYLQEYYTKKGFLTINSN